MSSIASERLSRLRLDLRGIARLLRSPALRALVGAHLIVAGIIVARSDGWLQPFELLTYDALRVAWASHARAPGYFWSTGTAIVGNIGTRKRLKYGAQGNMLNAGARLDGLTKTIGTRILVSADIVGKTRRHSFRPTGALVVKRSRWRNRGVRAD